MNAECKWTWKWSHELDGHTTPTAALGREFATQKEAEADIAACVRAYDHNVMYYQSPSGGSTYRMPVRVIG